MRILIFIALLCVAVQVRGQIYIDSYRFGGAAQLLLDAYPSAEVAFSVRKLRNAYTGNCITVRRASNGDTTSIGFVSNYLDTATLKTFCASTNCFVRTWHDQSGNGRNITETVDANQPQIISSGATILQNGHIALDFDGANDKLSTSTGISFLTGEDIAHTAIQVLKYDTLLYQESFAFGNSGSQNQFLTMLRMDSPTAYASVQRDNANILKSGTSGNVTTANQQLLLNFNSGATVTGYKNTTALYTGSDVNIGTITINRLTIGALGRGDFSGYLNGKAQEFVFWLGDKNADRTDISNNINNFYSIY